MGWFFWKKLTIWKHIIYSVSFTKKKSLSWSVINSTQEAVDTISLLKELVSLSTDMLSACYSALCAAENCIRNPYLSYAECSLFLQSWIEFFAILFNCCLHLATYSLSLNTINNLLIYFMFHFEQLLSHFTFIFQGLSILETEAPDCPSIAVNHLLLVLPVLQIIASPPRQTFSVYAPSSQSVSCIALQILRHVEVHTLPMIKQWESHRENEVCFVIINSLRKSLSYDGCCRYAGFIYTIYTLPHFI